MHLDNLEIEGFSSYKDLTSISIPDGITGIVGIINNKEGSSNGSGKTGLVMSIPYALYGSGEFTTFSEIINDQSDSVYIKLSFTSNGNHYLVERGFRKKGGSYLDFYENNNRLGNNIDTTQQEIIRIIKMDYAMFSASVFFVQLQMDHFINVRAEERRGYVDKVLDLELWRQSYKETVKETKIIIEKKEKDQQTLNSLSENFKNIEEVLKQKPSTEKEIENLLLEKESIQKGINFYTQYKTTKDQILNLMAMKEHEDKNLKSTKERQLKLDTDHNNDPALKDFPDNTKELKINIKTEKESLSSLESEIKLKKEEALNLSKEGSARLLYVQKYLLEIKSIESSKNDILSGICPTCKQEIDTNLLLGENKNLDDKILIIKDKIKTEELSYENLEKEFKDKEKEINSLNYNLQKKEKLIKDKEFQLVSAESNLRYKEQQEKFYIEQSNLYKNDIIRMINRITELRTEIDRLHSILPGNVDLDIDELNKQLRRLDYKISECNISLGSFKEKEKQKNEIADNIQIFTQTILDLTQQIEINSHLANILQEIPRIIFEESITELQNFSNDIIQQIMPEISVNIYEDSSKKASPLIIGFIVNGNERSYKRLSGGQKTIVNLGIRLAFSRVIAQRTDTHIEFVVLDEIFGSLDEENRELVKKVLTIISEYFKQILVITHTDDAKEFPNIITVRMDESGCSYI